MDTKMQTSDIVSKILAEAHEEAHKIAVKASHELAVQEAKRKERLASYTAETDTLAQRAGEDKKLRMLASARMEISRQVLAQKREVLDKVFAAVQQKLESMPKEDFEMLCIRLLKKAQISGTEEIMPGSKETRIDARTVERMNNDLGLKGNLKLSTQLGSFDYGFCLARGKMRINASADTLIRQERDDKESEIAAVLFE